MKLSILICTIPKRKGLFDLLVSQLSMQSGDVEILSDDRLGITTGAKRNQLIKKAKGEYVTFIDDDDTVSPNYVSTILKALESNPDAVGFKGWITTNGRNRKEWRISKNFPYQLHGGVYYRYNNHLSPMRKEIAEKIGFPNLSFGEDFSFAKRLHESGLIKTEVYVDKYLYTYNYLTHK